MTHADPSAEVRHNKLLAALPDCEYERLRWSLQPSSCNKARSCMNRA